MMKKWLFSVLTGIGLGFPMALLVLYMMISSAFTYLSIAFWITLVITVTLPHCLRIASKTGLSVGWMQAAMLITSYTITLLYGNAAAASGVLEGTIGNLYAQVFVLSSILHGVSLLGCGVVTWIVTAKKLWGNRRRKNK